jgi:hypothetical protein
MKPIFTLFLQICLLRQSPAYVPTYTWFVVLVVAANLLLSTFISLGMDENLDALRTATSIIVGQTTTAALVWLALTLQNVGERFVTTVTAIFGCDLLITVSFGLVMPLSMLWGTAVTTLILLVFLIWSVAVVGFILHRALEIPMPIGIGVAMLITLMSVTLGQLATGA